MPQIPIYQQHVGLPGEVPMAQPSMRVQAANPLEGVSGLARLGSEAMQVVQHQHDENSRVWAGNAASTAYVGAQQLIDDQKASAQPGAPDFVPQFKEKFDAYKQQVLATAPDANSKKFLNQHFDSMWQSMGTQAVQFQAQQGVANRVGLHDQAIDNMGKWVQQAPGNFDIGMQVLDETRPTGMPDGGLALKEKARTTLTNAAASNMIDTDPRALQEVTGKALGANGFTGATGIPWVDAATPDQIKSWNNAATVKVKQIDAQREAALSAAEAEAAHTVDSAVKLSESGQYFDAGFQQELLSKTAGTKFAGQAQELINDQKKTAGFSAAPAVARQAEIAEAHAASSNPQAGTNPTTFDTVTRAEKIDAAIKTAAAENPWSAGPKYGVRGIDPTLYNVSSPADVLALIDKRSAQLPVLEQWTGAKQSPLQPQEAEAFGNALRQLPPDQAATVLSAIGQKLNDPARLAALTKQIGDKDGTLGLAARYAGMSTNQGRLVGELILQGDQAIRDKTAKLDGMNGDQWRAQIAQSIGDAYPNQQLRSDVIDAAFKIAAAKGGNIDAAVKLATGGIVERNGAKVPLPYGMTESKFGDAIDGVKVSDLAAQAVDGKVYAGRTPIALDAFVAQISKAQLVNAGQGVYAIRSGGTLITNSAGQPMTIKVNP